MKSYFRSEYMYNTKVKIHLFFRPGAQLLRFRKLQVHYHFLIWTLPVFLNFCYYEHKKKIDIHSLMKLFTWHMSQWLFWILPCIKTDISLSKWVNFEKYKYKGFVSHSILKDRGSTHKFSKNTSRITKLTCGPSVFHNTLSNKKAEFNPLKNINVHGSIQV